MEIAEIFSDLLNSIDNIIHSLEKKEHSSSLHISNMDYFWSSMKTGSKVLSHQATKFAVAHSTPPFDPKDTKELGASLCQAAGHLADTYFTLPVSIGSTFLQVLSKELVLLFNHMKEFIKSVQRIVLYKEPVESCLFTTGVLWEFCDRIPLLPQNNFDAVIAIMLKEEQLISDALHELEQTRVVYNETVSSDSEDDSMIQGLGITILPSVKGLIKAAISCLRKTKILLKKPPQCSPVQLDLLSDDASSLSHNVDDMVCSIYSPMNIQQIWENANVLATHLQNILETLKMGISSENEQQWIDFLAVAVEHNLHKLRTNAKM